MTILLALAVALILGITGAIQIAVNVLMALVFWWNVYMLVQSLRK